MKSLSRTITLLLFFAFMITFGYNLSAESDTAKFKLSFSERFRFTGWDNAISLNDDSSESYAFTRHRTSIMLQWLPIENLEFAVKLTNEFRNYLSPKDREFNFHEIIFDQLYIKWDHVIGLPLTLTLGRQNLILGEGFVVFEGHPLDGSRSIYFNALRGDIQLRPNHKLTLFYSYQPVKDNILPVINDKEQGLVEQPERGIGVYYSGKLKKVGLEAYYIRKDVDEESLNTLECGINAFGARVQVPLFDPLSLTVEGVYQTGHWREVDHGAMGGYFHLDYKVGENIPLLKTITLGGIYLSGDDPATNKHEGWEPLFGRWPKWSESYIYTLVREKSVAYWSNLNSLYISLLTQLCEPMTLTMTYHRLGASYSSADIFFPGGSGKNRGDLFIGKLDFKINANWSGHFLWEHFNPGDFYFDGADPANWLRFEIMYRF